MGTECKIVFYKHNPIVVLLSVWYYRLSNATREKQMSNPIKCSTCNTVFGQKWPDFEVMIAQDPPYPMSMAADAIGLTEDPTMECCIRHFYTHPFTHRKMLHFEEQPIAPTEPASTQVDQSTDAKSRSSTASDAKTEPSESKAS